MAVNSIKPVIGIIPNLQGLGGPSSFHQKFIAGLNDRGIESTHDLSRQDITSVLVIAGSKHINLLRGIRGRGIPVIQRLDGVNWVHKLRYTGIKHFLRSEVNNWILRTIRDKIANKVIYQSQFSKYWWEKTFGVAQKPDAIIYNGIDLDTYIPKDIAGPENFVRIITVEGHLKNGLELGLFNVARVVNFINKKKRVEWAVAGETPDHVRREAEKIYQGKIAWLGIISRDEVRAAVQNSHIFFSAEMNPACPNSVIEALACGLPILGFDNGALREMVGSQAGVILPYAGDVWKLQPAGISEYPQQIDDLLHSYSNYRQAARKRAEEMFGLGAMVDAYLKELLS